MKTIKRTSQPIIRLDANKLFTTRTPSGGTQYTVEASEAGLPPGCWPDKIELQSPAEVWTLVRESLNEERAIYNLPMTGIYLKVWND